MVKKVFIFITLLLVEYNVLLANGEIDSLVKALNACNNNKCRITTTIKLSALKVFSESAQAIELAKKVSEMALKEGDNDLIAEAFNNEAYVHRHVGNYETAIEKYFLCIRYAEKANNKKFIAYANAQLGIIYMLQKDYKTGIEKLLTAEKLVANSGDNFAKGKLYEAIGNCYMELNDTANSEKYYSLSESFFIKSGNYPGIAQMLANRAEFYLYSGNIKNAERKLKECFLYSEKSNNNSSWVLYYLAKGRIELFKNQYTLAKKSFELALEYANKYSSNEAKRGSFDGLYKVHESLNDYKNALKFYILKSSYEDSLSNKELVKNITKAQANYEFSKKHLVDSLNYEKEKAVKNIEIKEKDDKLKGEKQFRMLLYLIILLVLLFSGFILKSYLDKNKANKIILVQKHLIEEKHKEITDSINYAERIQKSFLATNELLDANLTFNKMVAGSVNDVKSYFIMFKPKDIVSGDFYWASKLNNGNFAFVTADSTGHGVPGAIMSLLNITSLEKAIESSSNPAEILNKTRKTIIERLKKDGSVDGGKDGMDCSFLSFDFKNKKLEVAAANNPVWIVRKNTDVNLGPTLIEIKPDKMPVGKHDKDKEPFTLHTIELMDGDIVYSLTDGFPDQFGGQKGKKFMIKKLKELVLANQHLNLQEQKQLLEKVFADWVGNSEQVDDVTLVGISI